MDGGVHKKSLVIIGALDRWIVKHHFKNIIIIYMMMHSVYIVCMYIVCVYYIYMLEHFAIHIHPHIQTPDKINVFFLWIVAWIPSISIHFLEK